MDEPPQSDPRWGVIIAVILIVVAILAVFMFTNTEPQYEELAQCLTDTGTVMYGAWWCPHCAEQKRILGENTFKEHIDYIECATGGPIDIPATPLLCEQANITGFPTWEFSDGSRAVGVIQPDVLAQRSGCVVE